MLRGRVLHEGLGDVICVLHVYIIIFLRVNINPWSLRPFQPNTKPYGCVFGIPFNSNINEHILASLVCLGIVLKTLSFSI